jgi:peptidoglycan/xylan/chitin deacetylase (PgdA/CDA1 family)
MIFWIITGVLVLILAAGVIEFSLFIPAPKGLPILMYHKADNRKKDGLTVRVDMLEKQFEYISRKGYTAISFRELTEIINGHLPMPKKAVIITFDDAYRSFLSLVCPLLAKYKLKATLFVPVGYMGKTNAWDDGREAILSVEKIRQAIENYPVEAGLHSFLHRSYGDLSHDQIRADLESCFNALGANQLPYVKVLAYPFGSYPKKDLEAKEAMKQIFRDLGIEYACRIGNRINRIPFADPYELKRIDIRGKESFLTFRIKLKKGKRKLFA